MYLSKFKAFIFFILCVFFFASCSGGGSGDGGSVDTGTVSLNLMDLPNGEYKAVYVNISEVQVHKAGNTDNDGNDGDGSWLTVGSPNKIYNLLELVNGVTESLGTKELEAGRYTQVRLIIGEEIPLNQEGNPAKNINDDNHSEPNYVIDQSDIVIPLKIPSGFNTGIKLVHPFEVTKNGLMELILDFDAMNSIVKTGNGKLILKPTIKIIEALNYAEVSGQVSNNSGGLGGVRVSAQTYDTDSGVITEQAATYSDAEDLLGYYRLPLEPDQSYNIVAFSKDYKPKCAYLAAENGKDYIQDFDLAPSDNNLVSLDIRFEDSNPDPFPDVTVAFIYLDADCGDMALTDEIQVESIVAVYVYDTDESKYAYNDVYLPHGTYKLIASAEGYADFETLSPFTVDPDNPANPIVIIFEQ
jgi:hypothetical protein